jgi:hypothetical protein
VRIDTSVRAGCPRVNRKALVSSASNPASRPSTHRVHAAGRAVQHQPDALGVLADDDRPRLRDASRRMIRAPGDRRRYASRPRTAPSPKPIADVPSTTRAGRGTTETAKSPGACCGAGLRVGAGAVTDVVTGKSNVNDADSPAAGGGRNHRVAGRDLRSPGAQSREPDASFCLPSGSSIGTCASSHPRRAVVRRAP